MRKFFVLAIALIALTVGVPVWAQTTPQPVVPLTDAIDDMVNPDAQITWPPPVYVMRDVFAIRGTANVTNMNNYFIEFRQLQSDLESDETGTWFPALLPQTEPVVDDILGEWDTTLAADGLYELRMTITVDGGEPIRQVVSPVRIENTPPPFAVTPTPEVLAPTSVMIMAPTEAPITVATAVPTQDFRPRVTVNTPNGNVRAGNGLDFPIIGALRQGESAEIIGIASSGAPWYQIRLASNQVGWMSNDIVTVSGDTTNVPRVTPPPPPPPTAIPLPTLAPATFAPIATIAAATNVNLVAGNIYVDPNPPSCASTFSVGFDVANLGSQALTAGGTVLLTDVRVSDGVSQSSTTGGFPALTPNQTFRVDMRLTVSTYYNETHRLVLAIDTGNQIIEINEGDNQRTQEYTLQKGGCP